MALFRCGGRSEKYYEYTAIFTNQGSTYGYLEIISPDGTSTGVQVHTAHKSDYSTVDGRLKYKYGEKSTTSWYITGADGYTVVAASCDYWYDPNAINVVYTAKKTVTIIVKKE